MLIAASLVFCVAASTPAVTWRSLSADNKTYYTYEHFLAEFPIKIKSVASQQIFEANLAKIHEHNAKGLSWREGVNQFTDMSAAEFKQYKGKVPTGGAARALPVVATLPAGLPVHVDWRDRGAVTPVKNQGGCGSCWAFSATSSIESAVFMATGKLPVLAPQELVDCAPNPHQCGGTGGCSGSTEEYGFAYAMLHGMAADSTYNYTAKTGAACLLNKAGRVPVAGVTNFVKLPSNDYNSLMAAIATVGPISISVDASWGGYESGVYMGCDSSKTTIDHAVQLVGYGTESGKDYYLVRNSWGDAWGEDGYIKIFRQATPPCGEDKSPGSGNGCKDGPPSMKVCGACGILSDSSYPTGGFMFSAS